MASRSALEASWYGTGRAPWWSRPLAALYGALTGLRRALYRAGVLRSIRLPVPVIVVGNLTAGGAGKTPLTLALAEALRARGWRPGVASRGYGGSAAQPMLLGEAPDPAVAGDEPSLLRAAGLPVAIARERPAAGRLLVEAGCDVVIADDGLQHYQLARDLEICVIDGERRFGNGRLLPAGPLREPPARLRRVDFRVCNGGEAQPGEATMRLAGGVARELAGAFGEMPLSAFAGQRAHAVAGIGHPRRFFESLRGQGIEVIEHAFPDHHAYVPADLQFDDQAPVLMTEKDAVKCARFARTGWWSVPVRAVLPEEFFDQVAGRLQRKQGSTGAH